MLEIANVNASPTFADYWNRFVVWLGDNSWELLTAAGVAAAIFIGLFAARSFIRYLLGGEAATGWRGIAENVVARTRGYFMVVAAIRAASMPLDLPERGEQVLNLLFVIAVALQCAVWVRALILGAIDERIGKQEQPRTLGTALSLIRVFVTVAVFLIAMIVILDNAGVNVTALIAGLGIGGIAIGLAAQGIFKDLFAALSIIFDRPFQKGDTITFGSGGAAFTGTVEDIGLRTTRLRALDGELVSVGNDKLLQDRVHNHAVQERRRGVLIYPLLPNAEADRIAELTGQIGGIVSDQPQASFDRASLVKISPASADVEIVFFMETGDFGLYAATRQAILLEVQRRAAALGIAPPAPAPTGVAAA